MQYVQIGRRDQYHKFSGIVDNSRNPVDNPAALRASCSEREDRCNLLAKVF